jgi:hypothetical protein
MPENADPLYYGLNKNKMLRPREIAYKIEEPFLITSMKMVLTLTYLEVYKIHDILVPYVCWGSIVFKSKNMMRTEINEVRLENGKNEHMEGQQI